MDKLELSKDLNIITAEIQSYKQIAGQSIFEIGRRLKHVKENDLVYGEFGSWLESIDFNQSQASRFIKVYEELGDTNLLTSANVGFRNLLEIATLPEEQRDKEHVTSKGETKTADEMTVRELQELKKKLKEKDSQLEQAKRSEQIAIEQLEREQSKEPEIIEKEIEIERIPDDYDYYKSNYEATKSNYEFYKKQNDELRNEMKLLEERIGNAGSNTQEVESLKLELEEVKQNLRRKEEEYHRLDNFKSDAEEIIYKYAPIKYFKDFDEVLKDKQAFGDLEETINMLEKWIKEMKEDLPNQIIIEGAN